MNTLKNERGKVKITITYKTRFFFFLISIFYQVLVWVQVIQRNVNTSALIFWLISLGLLYISFPHIKNKKKVTVTKIRTNTLAIILILFGVLLRVYFMLDNSSYHIDEYLSAHFSYSLPSFANIDWFGVYPPPGVWIVQFPVLYFAIQKLFFNIFGLSTLVLRLSTLPYLIAVFVFLFLIAKSLFRQKVALASVAILTIFSADIYITKWGLHFISSTAFFMASLYFFITAIKIKNKLYYALFGLFLAFCYLTYYSSYVAVPLFIFYLIILILKRKIKLPELKYFLFSALIFIYTLSPIAVYALKVDNFFTQRTEQVKLINGLWSPYKEIDSLTHIVNVLHQQTLLSLSSLFKDGVGGHGGYIFGKLALFDPITLIIFSAGILYFIYKALRFKVKSIFILVSIFTVFFAGMVLTFPPPAFHRLSLIFPLVALVMAVTIIKFSENLSRIIKVKDNYLTIALILLLTISNLYHFGRIRENDGTDDPDFPKIEQQLVKHDQDMVYVAAFPSYSLGKVLYIRSEEKINSVTERLDELLPQIPRDELSFIVLLYPNDEILLQVQDEFPNMQIIGRYNTHALVTNLPL